MTTWLFFVALHLWILSVTNLKSISIFAGCIEYLSFLSWNQFCYSPLHFEFRINNFWTAFVAIFTIFEHYWHKFFVYLCWVTHVLCHWWPWKFCCVENCLMLSVQDDKIDLSSVAVTELQKCLEKSGEHMVSIQLWFSIALCLATWLAFFFCISWYSSSCTFLLKTQIHYLQHLSGKSYRIT